MTLLEKRAIKITELYEELSEARKIISEFVWPGDGSLESHQKFLKKAAKFANCQIPSFGTSEGSSLVECEEAHPTNYIKL